MVARGIYLGLTLSVALGSGCSVAVAGDAISNCHDLENVINQASIRCGGHALDESHFSCDTVIASNMTASGVEACRAKLESAGCDAVRGQHMPSECVFSIDHLF